MTEPVLQENDRRVRSEVIDPDGQNEFTYDFPVIGDGVAIYVDDVEASATHVPDAKKLVLDVKAEQGAVVVVEGKTKAERELNYPLRGGLPSSRLNEEANKAIYLLQELKRDLARTFVLAKSAANSVSLIVPAPIENRVLVGAVGGTGFVNGPSTTELTEVAGHLVEIDAVASNIAAVAGVHLNIAAVLNCSTNMASVIAAPSAAAAAQAAAAQAVSAAAEGLYNEIVHLTAADSPFTPGADEEGTLYRITTIGGAVTINLSALAVYGEDMKFAFVKENDGGANVTINAGGTNTINGASAVTLINKYETHCLIGDESAGLWIDTVQSTGIPDGSLVTAKYADDSVTLAKMEHGTQGQILFYGASGAPTRLAAGTPGQRLVTKGAGQNPAWESRQFVHVAHEVASGTAGGASTAGAWNTRPLNTVKKNTLTGASLATNRITLPAGDYVVSGGHCLYASSTYSTRLRDITNSVTLLQGVRAHAASGATDATPVVGMFTLAAQADIELQYYCGFSQGTNGLGVAQSTGDVETYANLLIEKL